MRETMIRLFENPEKVRVITQEIMDVVYDGKEMVTIYMGDKYAQWHGDFARTAPLNPELRPLVEYLSYIGYRQNLIDSDLAADTRC